MKPRKSSVSRRQFLSSAATASTLAAASSISAYAGGSDMIKVGLIGCGGRGTGAAANAIKANDDSYIKLHALGDAFPEKMTRCLDNLKRDLGEEKFSSKVDVPAERQFTGFDAYKNVIDSSDVVLLCTPPGFRPMHLRAAVEAGKHIFCEKPMAVDAPGVRSVIESAKIAKEKNKCLVSGFCYRYDPPKRETIKRIHDGAIGDVLAVHCNYIVGQLWSVARTPEMADMEWQVRNWYYFTWLSGDHIVEQHVHNLDKASWVFKDTPPVAAYGLGGRQVRIDPKFGHIFDHHAVVFEYSNGRRLFSFCRQINGCYNSVSDHVIGSKGSAQLMKHEIEGANNWKYEGSAPDMYQVEHNELFAAIRAGKVINDGEFMAQSTMMAILGRMATYTGQRITWEKAMASTEDLMAGKDLDMKAKADIPPVAKPGITKFV